MDEESDAYGQALVDYHEGGDGFEVVERDDGFLSVGGGPEAYFSPYEEWLPCVQTAVDRARGRVLDVGCGAGRHALHLQEQGQDVVGIDVSPGAVDVCADRGLDARQLDVVDADELGADRFDTVLMLGNNFGLVGTRERAPDVLGALARVTTDDATLLAHSRDPRGTDDPDHREYHELNRERGRLPGALRLRIRYLSYATDWFDYLLAAPEEMADLVADTPWAVAEYLHGEDGEDARDPSAYVGVLRKD